MTEDKKLATSSNSSNEEESCFVIMPFGRWFDKYYNEIYAPAVKNAALIPRRADDFYRVGTIINDIWTLTGEAKMILADLTGKNPNVLYELGLAHALAKPAILISQTMEDIPFDLRSLRIITYDKNEHNWGIILKENITKSILEVLESPLKAVLPTFLEITFDKSQEPISENEKLMLTLRGEIESLRSSISQLTLNQSTGNQFVPERRSSRIPSDRLLEEARNQIIAGIRKGAKTESMLKRLSTLGIPEHIGMELIHQETK